VQPNLIPLYTYFRFTQVPIFLHYCTAVSTNHRCLSINIYYKIYATVIVYSMAVLQPFRRNVGTLFSNKHTNMLYQILGYTQLWSRLYVFETTLQNSVTRSSTLRTLTRSHEKKCSRHTNYTIFRDMTHFYCPQTTG